MRHGRSPRACRSSSIWSELNGNEKYAYLDDSLPVGRSARATIARAGDIMLFGDDCLVLFYETFSSSYRYTRIG